MKNCVAVVKMYLIIFKTAFVGSLIHRFHYLFMFLTNITYITITYFFWKAAYSHSGGTLQGMDFNQVFVYLAMSSSIFTMFQSWVEWDFSRAVITGNIVVDLVKPYDFQFKEYFRILGYIICKSLTILLPSLLVLTLVFRCSINVGYNLLFFLAALVFSFTISFHIDYFVGLITFITQSVWGLSIAKELTVLLLSGAMIPLKFFPEGLARIVRLLPFHAIYDTPMMMLTSTGYTLNDFLQAVSNQMMWSIVLIIVCKLFYARVSKSIMLNGG